MKLLYLLSLVLVLTGCKTTGYRVVWENGADKPKIEEYIELKGTAKHTIKFGTGGEAEADSGFRIPDVNVSDLEFDK